MCRLDDWTITKSMTVTAFLSHSICLMTFKRSHLTIISNITNIWPKISGHLTIRAVWCCWKFHCKTRATKMWVGQQLPLCSMGICGRSPRRVSVRSSADVGRDVLAGNHHSSQSQLSSSTLYGRRFVHRGSVILEQQRAFSKWLAQSWKHPTG